MLLTINHSIFLLVRFVLFFNNFQLRIVVSPEYLRLVTLEMYTRDTANDDVKINMKKCSCTFTTCMSLKQISFTYPFVSSQILRERCVHKMYVMKLFGFFKVYESLSLKKLIYFNFKYISNSTRARNFPVF